VIDRRAVGVLLVDGEHFRRAVRRPRSAFVGTVLSNQQLAGQWMIIGREADRVAVPVPPPHRLDRTRIVKLRAQRGTVADALSPRGVGRIEERRYFSPKICMSEERIAARLYQRREARGEGIVAQRDVAGPCGWKTLVPPVWLVASVGFPRVRNSVPLWSKTSTSGVKGLGLPGKLV